MRRMRRVSPFGSQCRRPAFGVAVVISSVLGLMPSGASAQSDPLRISRGLGGSQSDGRSELPAVNGDGSVVAFKSLADNLIANDGNDRIDVFVWQRSDGSIERAPREPDTGDDPQEESYPPVLSEDGRYVAFGSAARNLVRGDFNRFPDAYVYDRGTGRMENLTLVRDINDEGLLGGRVPDLPLSISVDGRFVAYTSASADLTNVTDTNETHDVFVHDGETGSAELISSTTLGSPSLRAANDLSAAPALSPDGQFVAFCSEASNLVAGPNTQFAGIFLRDRAAGTTVRIANLGNNNCLRREYSPAVSDGGSVVAFASNLPLVEDDRNGVVDVYVWSEGQVRLVSRPGDGNAGNGASSFVSLSADGRFLAFQSLASDLDPAGDSNGFADVFVVDLTDDRITRVTTNDARGDSFAPAISRDGTIVVFQSNAALVPDDTNGLSDIYSQDNTLAYTPTPDLTATAGAWTPTPDLTATAGAWTPTPNLTATAASWTPTPNLTATAASWTPTPDLTKTAASWTATPTPSPDLTATAAARGTSTPTPTVARTPSNPGSDNDGCGCRIDPVTRRATSSLPLFALLPPVALLLLRRRRDEVARLRDEGDRA